MPPKLPIEVSYLGIRSSHIIEDRIHQLVQTKLVPVCSHLNRCDVVVEKTVDQPRGGKSLFRVRMTITVPPSHRVVVTRTLDRADTDDAVLTLVQDAVRAARRRLKKMTEMQRREVKAHPDQQIHGIVRALDGDEGEIETIGGDSLPFHLHAVRERDREHIRLGAGVTFTTKEDEQGWRASTVRVVDGRGIDSAWQ